MTREEAINILNTETCYECTYGCMSTANCENEKCPLKKAVLMAIKALEPKTGHWKKLDVGYGCSECSLTTNESGKNFYRYCPNCGAKMEVEE